mgnify:CR=1 FL=1
MGKRNCAVEGCNALEFRSNGICNRHMRDEMAIREIDLEELQVAAQEEPDESEHALGQMVNTYHFSDVNATLSEKYWIRCAYY